MSSPLASRPVPTVTVIIPAYNAAATLGRAIDSVLAQTGCKLDILVVDDGSTDATPALLDRYAGRIRVLKQANSGVSAARNLGIENATGEFIAFLDSDDEWLCGKLEKQLALMQSQPAVDLVYCGVEYVSPDGRRSTREVATVSGDKGAERLARGNLVCTSSVLARSRCFQDGSIRFPPSLTLGEDYVVWLSLAISGRVLAAIPESLVRYAVNSNPRKYSPEEFRQYSAFLEQIIAGASSLCPNERQRLMRLRRSANSLELASFYVQQRRWLHALREVGHGWALDPGNVRGVARFLWRVCTRVIDRR